MGNTETLTATTTSVGHIATLLSCITAVSSKALVVIDADGINFTSQDSHISRISLALEETLFTTYEFQGEPVTFNIDLKPIVESLTLNQSHTVECTIHYRVKGDPFILIFEDSKIMERCEFNTFVETEMPRFEVMKVEMEGIIQCGVLYDSLRDLRDLNSEEIFLYGDTQRRPKFAIVSKSEMGESIVYLPNEKSILEKLNIAHNDMDLSSYKFSIFEKCLKSLKISTKCKFQKDEALLSLSLLSEKTDGLPQGYNGTIIEFQILQLVDKDEQIEELRKRFKLQEEPVQLQRGVEEIDDINIDVPIFL